MRIEELAGQVGLRLAGRDTAGRRTPRFARVQDTWLVRHPRNFEWTVTQTPLAVIRAAIGAYLMERTAQVSAGEYRALVELCADEDAPSEVLALLAADPTFTLQSVDLRSPDNAEWLRSTVGRPGED